MIATIPVPSLLAAALVALLLLGMFAALFVAGPPAHDHRRSIRYRRARAFAATRRGSTFRGGAL